MYRLDLELPQGLYSVSAMLGASTESKTVLLDRESQVTLISEQPSFGDLAFAVMGQIQAEVGAMQFDAGGTTIVTVRGPFAATRSRKHKVQVKAGGVLIKADVDEVITENADQFWHWQLFRVSKPGPITVMREVNGEKFSHTVPRFGAWTIWAAYPAPPEVAHPEVTLPNPFYARMRLTQSGNAPDLSLQSLSDQVFTALASRTALPLSKPVLDLLFGDGADPLLALAAAHLISLKLCRYGRLKWLPQDRVRSAPPSGEDANEERLTEEPVSLDEIHECVRTWLMAPRTEEIADCPDMIAVRYLYGINTDFADDFELEKPPVLLRSLDALFDIEHTASERHRKFVLRDSVWSTQFQVSDAFALLQWHTNAETGKNKRLDLLRQSFVMSKALEHTLQKLHGADVEETSTPASAFEATGVDKDMGRVRIADRYRKRSRLTARLQGNRQLLVIAPKPAQLPVRKTILRGYAINQLYPPPEKGDVDKDMGRVRTADRYRKRSGLTARPQGDRPFLVTAPNPAQLPVRKTILRGYAINQLNPPQEKGNAALVRIMTKDFHTKTTGVDASLKLDESELKSYLEMNAQALRLPSTAIEGLTKEIARQVSIGTPPTALIGDTPRDIARLKKDLKDLMA